MDMSLEGLRIEATGRGEGRTAALFFQFLNPGSAKMPRHGRNYGSFEGPHIRRRAVLSFCKSKIDYRNEYIISFVSNTVQKCRSMKEAYTCLHGT